MKNIASLLLFFLVTLAARGDDIHIIYPPGTAVYNVVTDGGVDNTGKTDVTEQLQKLMGKGGAQIIYFPKGTYLVSASLRMKLDTSRSDKSHSFGPWITGESKTETIIRLKDGIWPTAIYQLETGANG